MTQAVSAPVKQPTPARYQRQGAAAWFADRAEQLGVPVSVTFQITDRCNYRCAHCYETHGEAEELSTGEIKRILGEIAAAGVLFLTLTGGEVFMRRDLDEILVEARRLQFAVRLYTTGHFVDKERARRLKELAIQEVHLSLYAPDAQTHDAVTLMPGSFERTVAAARRLRAENVFVVLKSPVMAGNVRKVEAYRALVTELDCKYAMDPTLTTREDGERSPLHLRPSAEDLTQFFATYDTEIRAPDPAPFDYAAQNRTGPCSIGRTSCSINPQGLVFGCASLPVPVGDLRKDRFASVWRDSPQLSRLRSITWGDLAICNTCEVRPYCSRCHAMALLEDGNMLGPSTESCRQAVAARESLRQRGLIAADAPAPLPPPLRDGAKPDRHRSEPLAYGFRPAGLRVIY